MHRAIILYWATNCNRASYLTQSELEFLKYYYVGYNERYFRSNRFLTRKDDDELVGRIKQRIPRADKLRQTVEDKKWIHTYNDTVMIPQRLMFRGKYVLKIQQFELVYQEKDQGAAGSGEG